MYVGGIIRNYFDTFLIFFLKFCIPHCILKQTNGSKSIRPHPQLGKCWLQPLKQGMVIAFYKQLEELLEFPRALYDLAAWQNGRDFNVSAERL